MENPEEITSCRQILNHIWNLKYFIQIVIHFSKDKLRQSANDSIGIFINFPLHTPAGQRYANQFMCAD